MPFRNEESKRFAELITALAVTFGKEADHPLFVGYEMALDDLPLSAIETAVRRAIRECKFMPSGRGLRDMAGVMTGDVKTDDRALIAYTTAADAARSHGAYQSVEFADPLINACIKALGGWVVFCNWLTEEVQWRKRDFLSQYKSYSAAGISAELCAPLAGICETANGPAGYGTPPVQRIEVDLPPVRPGIVKGDIPKRITSQPVNSVVANLATTLRIAEEPAPPAKPARREWTAEEFAAHKAASIKRLTETITPCHP